jgi:hypothetical protein
MSCPENGQRNVEAARSRRLILNSFAAERRSMAGARSQFFRGVKPVVLGRSIWTAPGLPQSIRQGRDVIMSECGDAMSIRNRQSIPMRVLRVLESLR